MTLAEYAYHKTLRLLVESQRERAAALKVVEAARAVSGQTIALAKAIAEYDREYPPP